MSWADPDILLILCSLVVSKDLLLIFLFGFNFKSINKSTREEERDDGLPFISVLIAARNEEKTITRCIDSLKSQKYPKHRYEILVGNDRSEDNTYKVLEDLEVEIENLVVFNINELVQKKHGKMNVLAQLGEKAQGEYLLFTDADTQLPETWILTHVKQLMRGFGIVTGATYLQTETTFEKLQSIEWVHAIGMMKVVSDLNINVSSIGNNMSVSREAYESVGGFKGIPYSITEDYEIYHQVCKKGNKSFHIFEKQVLAQSVAASTIWDLLMQRKRWMFGAFRLPLPMLSLLVLNTLYYPIAALLMIQNIELGIIMVLVRVLVQGIFINKAFIKLECKVKWPDVFVYEFYAMIINLWAIFVFLLPFPIKWKGRKY